MKANAPKVVACVCSISWVLLRDQKNFLIAVGGEHASGLIHMIDHLQDAAVADGLATEETVFGGSPNG